MPRQSAKHYTSVQLIQLARDNVRAAEVNTLPAIAGIVFSALSLEAIVNEMLDRVRDPWRPESAVDLIRVRSICDAAGLNERMTSIETKVAVLAVALGAQDNPMGRQPYQDFRLLIQIRNFLVHLRPDIRDQGDDGVWNSHKILLRLAERGVIAMPLLSRPTMTINELQSASVARWAFETMVSTVQDLLGLFPVAFAEAEQLGCSYGRDNLDL
jgi:hypothetical protein